MNFSQRTRGIVRAIAVAMAAERHAADMPTTNEQTTEPQGGSPKGFRKVKLRKVKVYPSDELSSRRTNRKSAVILRKLDLGLQEEPAKNELEPASKREAETGAQGEESRS